MSKSRRALSGNDPFAGPEQLNQTGKVHRHGGRTEMRSPFLSAAFERTTPFDTNMTWIVRTTTMFGYGIGISDILVTLSDGSECDVFKTFSSRKLYRQRPRA